MLRRTVVTSLCRRSRLTLQTSCPFSGGVVNPTTTATTTSTCPIMGSGSLPKMGCPVEDEEMQVMPFKTIVSQTGKTKLSGFVTATAVVGYVMAGGTNPIVAAALTAGTMLQSMSANTANQTIEMNHDKLMKRTCRRPLPTGAISRQNAALLSAAEFAVGTSILAAVSPYAAALGGLNWLIYVTVYTPLKRYSATNTWFGSIVGGIPPLMGGVAVTSSLACPAMMPANLLGAFMLAWQIPHFMALSFHCRRDYESAGYKMLAFANPWRASFYAIALSVIMAAITLAGPLYISMPIEWMWYLPVVAIANGVMIYKSVLFHMDPVRHCRSCFVFSYLYLGVMLAAFCVNHVEPVGKFTALVEYALGTD